MGRNDQGVGLSTVASLKWSMMPVGSLYIAEPALLRWLSSMARELGGTCVMLLVHRTRLAGRPEQVPLVQVQRALAVVKQVRTASLQTDPWKTVPAWREVESQSQQ